ncbi:MAG: hypothetical protein MK213_04070 [Planctomycetes bacterium]|nr:hypothetical protein [Planctomycetota bacterium]
MSVASLVHVVDARLELLECRTRLPFRFGVHTLTGAPYATAVVEVETPDGKRARGASSDLLVPKWFEKDLNKTPEEDSAGLADSARSAFAHALAERTPQTVFDLWHSLYRERIATQSKGATDLLVRGFGVSLLERAVMDAVCRLKGLSFHQALQGDLFGFEPGRIHSELSDWSLAESLPKTPRSQAALRHTIGLVDALTPEEAAAGDNPQDGFPNSLQEDVERFGLTWFKVKIAGRGQEDVNRLLAIAKVLQSCGVECPQLTLDGNEQFASMDALADVLELTVADPLGDWLLQGLAFIEQPLARADTFSLVPHAGLERVRAFAPVLVDEADFGTWSFPEAIELGYEGISVKACKGVFRALLNRGLCAVRGGGLFQSGEDLTNLPVRALQQDLALMASLDISHVERNGHHYFRGLDHLPADLAQAACDSHSDLYRSESGTVSLRVQNGMLSLASLDCPGFGCRLDP